MKKEKAFKAGLAVCLFLLAIFGIKLWLTNSFESATGSVFGVTFSQKYATELGLDWQKTYLAILDDLKVKELRLVAYWSEIEKEPGEYNFSDLDWQINEAAKRGAKIVLAIGQRVPRWPECHFPDWVNNLSKTEREENLLKLLKTEIEHFKNEEAIFAWQVENEPLLTLFSTCPKNDLSFLKKEVMTVRELDTRPIIISDSGELSFWSRVSQATKILGITMYRVVWNKYLGYFKYDYLYPASYYHYKAKFIKWFFGLQDVIITEYQAEPWGPNNKGLSEVELSEQLKTMNAEIFDKHLKFAKKTGFDKIYLWGVEWWYWLKEQNDESMWKKAKEVF